MPLTAKANARLRTISAVTFSRFAGVIFFLIAVVHLMRLAQGWLITINGERVPLWVSAVALIVALMLGSLGATAMPENKGGAGARGL